ncbi:MAG: hypothetical protein WBB69_17485 [Anaerolineales bacterium]
MPAEKITETISEVYGVIPLHRGSYDRAALNKALDVITPSQTYFLIPGIRGINTCKSHVIKLTKF